MGFEVLDENIVKISHESGDAYVLAASGRGCALGDDMVQRWREVEACQHRSAPQGYMNSYAQLKAEPKNRYDPNAIEILARGEEFGHMGYIAKEQTAAVRRLAEYADVDLCDITVFMSCSDDVGFKTVRLLLIAGA